MIPQLKVLKNALKLEDQQSFKILSHLIYKIANQIEEGDIVRLEEGRYQSLRGLVFEINQSTQVASIIVEMFGKSFPTESPLSSLTLIEKGEKTEKRKESPKKIDPRTYPAAFLEEYGINLDDPIYENEEMVRNFELALKSLGQKLRGASQSGLFSILRILIPVFEAYPEYFNFKVIDPEWLISYFFNNIGTSNNKFLKLITEKHLTEALNLTSKTQAQWLLAGLISSGINYSGSDLNLLIEAYPNFTNQLLFGLLDKNPETYFELHLDKYLDTNPEKMAKEVLKKKPKLFINLRLYDTYPYFSDDGLETSEYMSGVKDSKSRAVEKIVSNKEFHLSDLSFLVRHNLDTEYPEVIEKIKHKVLHNEKLLRELFYSIGYYKNELPDNFPEQIVEELINQERYDEFFNEYQAYKHFPDFGFKVAKKLWKTNNELFHSLELNKIYDF